MKYHHYIKEQKRLLIYCITFLFKYNIAALHVFITKVLESPIVNREIYNNECKAMYTFSTHEQRRKKYVIYKEKSQK